MPVRHPSAQSKTGTRLCTLNFRPTFDLRHATGCTDSNLSLPITGHSVESIYIFEFFMPTTRLFEEVNGHFSSFKLIGCEKSLSMLHK